MLEVQKLSVSYGDKKILNDVSFSLQAGQWLMIAGPNGAGKSTLACALSQGCAYGGKILFEGEDTAKMRTKRLGRRLGFLAQSHQPGYSFTVRQLVALGRYPYSQGALGGGSPEDSARIEAAITAAGLTELSERSVLSLSGGELQRAFLAQLFAQNPRIIVLDEPTNNLDLLYQKQTFELIGSWIRTPGRAVISVVHDLSLARLHGTEALLLNHGQIAAAGSPETVFSAACLSAVYGMDVVGYLKSVFSCWSGATD
jgi:iron complex transport system ATP-binding protein